MKGEVETQQPKPPRVTHWDRGEAVCSAAICLKTNCEDEKGDLQKGF